MPDITTWGYDVWLPLCGAVACFLYVWLWTATQLLERALRRAHDERRAT